MRYPAIRYAGFADWLCSGVGFAEHDFVPDDEAVYLLVPFKFGQFPANVTLVELQLLGKFVKPDGTGLADGFVDGLGSGSDLGHVGGRR